MLIINAIFILILLISYLTYDIQLLWNVQCKTCPRIHHLGTSTQIILLCHSNYLSIIIKRFYNDFMGTPPMPPPHRFPPPNFELPPFNPPPSISNRPYSPSIPSMLFYTSCLASRTLDHTWHLALWSSTNANIESLDMALRRTSNHNKCALDHVVAAGHSASRCAWFHVISLSMSVMWWLDMVN